MTQSHDWRTEYEAQASAIRDAMGNGEWAKAYDLCESFVDWHKLRASETNEHSQSLAGRLIWVYRLRNQIRKKMPPAHRQ